MQNFVTLALLLHLLMDDMHYIHFNCRGREFKTIHELAKAYYDKLGDDFDDISELCMEYGASVPNPIHAAQLLNYQPLDSKTDLHYKESIALMRSLLSRLLDLVYRTHEACDDPNMRLYLEDLMKYWHKQRDFILARMEDNVTEHPGETGESLLERMPEVIFDKFRSIFDKDGAGCCRKYLETIYPEGAAKSIMIAFSRKNNFANEDDKSGGGDEPSISPELEKKLKSLDEKVLQEIAEFLQNPSEESLNKLSEDAKKFLSELSEDELTELQQLAGGGDSDGNSSEGGSEPSLSPELEEKLKSLDEKVLQEIAEFLQNPSEESLNKLSDDAKKFLSELSEDELTELQQLVSGEGGGSESKEDEVPVEDQILQQVKDLSPDELEELRFILFDPKGKEGSGKDPQITKQMNDFIDSLGPENYDRLKEAVSSVKSPDLSKGEEAPADPTAEDEGRDNVAARAPEGSGEPQDTKGDLVDRFPSLDDDTKNELWSIIKVGKGTGTNIKIERELMDELSRMSDERINMLAKLVDDMGDGLPHENPEQYEAPVQDPNKAPTNLTPDHKKSQIIMQDPSNYRLDSVPGGRVSDPAAAQNAMNQANQSKIQAFSRRYARNFNNIAEVYAQIESILGGDIPKDNMDSIIQAYEQNGAEGIAALFAGQEDITPDMIQQLAFAVSQKDPQENFRASFARQNPWFRG